MSMMDVGETHEENDAPPFQLPLHMQNSGNEGRIIRRIVSYLSLKDAAYATTGRNGIDTPVPDSWLFGFPADDMDAPRWSSPQSPPTPGLMAISPDPDQACDDHMAVSGDSYHMSQQRRRSRVKEKLAAAIFSHPNPLRSFCVDAFVATKEVAAKQYGDSPETLIEPMHGPTNMKGWTEVWLHSIISHVLNNVPLSVFLDVLEASTELWLDSSYATIRISGNTLQGLVNVIFGILMSTWDTIQNFNPLALFQIVISRPFTAMGKTTEAVVSGIQSVATGVGSASSMALRNFSVKATPASARQGSVRRRRSSPGNAFNEKLLKKLSNLNSAAPVVSYTEIADDTGGLSRHAQSRVHRMMHYEINLRPFVATVKLPVHNSFGGLSRISSVEGDDVSHASYGSHSSPESPFMCTPQSFPPTPSSRRMVLARGTRFADDVIFLARDQLRVHDALDSENERTREMAMALAQGRRLAVFDADDASAGIDLTCGQHVAAKVGNMLYCSTRSMVPVLRNCFVYFEITVLPRNGGNLIPQASMATLSVGLSTKEMPPNTLVGAWQGSVGLCTTGQLLTAGEWCSPVDPSSSSFGDRATVGCLVCLDDSSAFETWDGVMVTASVTFNVDGNIVSPPVSTHPITYVGRSAQESQQTPVRTVPPSFTLPLLVPAEEELYPTVTLHSPGVAVMARFSTGDLLSSSREAIGAPRGVTVYCVDGSVILKETD
eukprot:scaffold1561_cov129-Cylindrotheca_fusiformis.AAC.19